MSPTGSSPFLIESDRTFAHLLPGPFYDRLRVGFHQSRLSMTEAAPYTFPVPRFMNVVVSVKSIQGTLRAVKRFLDEKQGCASVKAIMPDYATRKKPQKKPDVIQLPLPDGVESGQQAIGD